MDVMIIIIHYFSKYCNAYIVILYHIITLEMDVQYMGVMILVINYSICDPGPQNLKIHFWNWDLYITWKLKKNLNIEENHLFVLVV